MLDDLEWIKIERLDEKNRLTLSAEWRVLAKTYVPHQRYTMLANHCYYLSHAQLCEFLATLGNDVKRLEGDNAV